MLEGLSWAGQMHGLMLLVPSAPELSSITGVLSAKSHKLLAPIGMRVHSVNNIA